MKTTVYTLYGYNIQTISNTKLGLLEKAGVLNIISRENPVVIDDNGFKIGIEAQEYHSHIDENMNDDFKITNINVDYNILLSHSMLLEYKFHEGVKYTLIKDVVTTADLVLAGHYHDGWKERDIDGTWFFNPGSLLRIEASTAMINSTPKVLIFEIDKGNLTYEYKTLPSAKKGNVIFSSKNLANRIYNTGLEDFHNKLKNQRFKGINIIDLINNYAINNPSDIKASEYAISMINNVAVASCDKGYQEEDHNIYIEKVELVNFQAHSKKVVDFIDGLNVIVGESNAGKSSILRAIHWCLYDKPNGSDFIKTGCKSCKVTLHLSNGYKVERKRSKTSSGSYTVTAPDGSVGEYKGFSNNIPIEILNANQMPEVKINGTGYKINVAMQLDQPFLIGNSATERLSLIGALVDADRADTAKREITSLRKRTNLERNQVIEFKTTKEEEIKKYSHLDKMKKDIDIIEIVIDRIEINEDKLNILNSINKDYNKSLSEYSNVINRLNDISMPSKELIDDYKKSLELLELLKNVKHDYETANDTLKFIDSKLESIPDTNSIKEPLNELNQAIEEFKALSDINNKYVILKHEMSNIKSKDVVIDTDKVKSLLSEFIDTLNTIEELLNVKAISNNISTSLCKTESEILNIDDRLKSLNDEKHKRINSLQGIEQVCEYCGSIIDINKMLGVE